MISELAAASEAEELFRASVSLIERVVRRVCHDAGLRDADAEDFASDVNVALIKNDYAVLRAWQQRSSLATYLTVVIKRLLSDERNKTRGRWEPSASARRGGQGAILLETLVCRDGQTLDEALPRVRALDPLMTRERAETILAALPERALRPRLLPLDDGSAEAACAPDEADAAVTMRELAHSSVEASRVVRRTLASFGIEDRAIVRLHFGSSMSLADISRMLRLPQRPLYRRLEMLLRALRQALVNAGIDAATAGNLIGSAVQALDFDLANGKSGATPESMKEEPRGKVD